MARENNSASTAEVRRAKKLEQEVSSIIERTKQREGKLGYYNLYNEQMRSLTEVLLLLWSLGLIKDYTYPTLSWKSKYRVNIFMKLILSFLEADEENNTKEKR
ncbi:MAG TPA: hypothetical protein PKL88_03330 [bacterium]|nr:hypothetical protein [bacterium]HPD74067.1 hypothetical protein [bacterium]HRY56567.1 hypothetical protein [Patescibacteria group bacterium]